MNTSRFSVEKTIGFSSFYVEIVAKPKVLEGFRHARARMWPAWYYLIGILTSCTSESMLKKKMLILHCFLQIGCPRIRWLSAGAHVARVVLMYSLQLVHTKEGGDKEALFQGCRKTRVQPQALRPPRLQWAGKS